MIEQLETVLTAGSKENDPITDPLVQHVVFLAATRRDWAGYIESLKSQLRSLVRLHSLYTNAAV